MLQLDLFEGRAPVGPLFATLPPAARAPAPPLAALRPEIEADKPPAPRAACVANQRPADPLGDALIAAGYVPNEFILDLNRSLQLEQGEAAPWSLPSRLFQYPVAVIPPEQDRNGTWQPRKIGLRHPLLIDHPGVQALQQALGLDLAGDPPCNRWGVSTHHGTWHHAVDLISAGHWRDLLATQRFTTQDDIIGAVAYGLDYGPDIGARRGKPHLSPAEARTILKEIGADMPSDPGPEDALQACQLTECKQEGGKVHRPVNWSQTTGSLANTWGLIVGIERGWFKQGRFLQWTEAAQRREAVLI